MRVGSGDWLQVNQKERIIMQLFTLLRDDVLLTSLVILIFSLFVFINFSLTEITLVKWLVEQSRRASNRVHSARQTKSCVHSAQQSKML